MKFYRMHIPNKVITEGEFNKYHHRLFDASYPVAYDELKAIALSLINEWNRESPKVWKYWLKG